MTRDNKNFLADMIVRLVLVAVGVFLGWTLHRELMPKRVVCGWYDMGHITPNVPPIEKE